MKKFLLASLLASSLLATSFAAECDFVCKHDGSLVKVTKSCEITTVKDCRGNDLELENDVIVTIKDGGKLSFDYDNHKMILKPGSKIIVEKDGDSKIANFFVMPTIKFDFKILREYQTVNKTDALADLVSPGSRGRVDWRSCRTWTVPDGVNEVKVSYTEEWHEEKRCDHAEFDFYIGSNRLIHHRERGNGSRNISNTYSVTPGQTLQFCLRERHDSSITRGNSYLKNIKISYTQKIPVYKPQTNITFDGYLGGISKIVIQAGGKQYQLTTTEIQNKKVENVLAKLGFSDINQLKDLKIIFYTTDGKTYYGEPNGIIEKDGARMWSDGTYAKSCKGYLYSNDGKHIYVGDIGDGWYWIKPLDNKPAIKVWCKMSNMMGWTFYPVKNGIRTYKTTDDNTCKQLGLMLFAPTSKQHYEAGRDFAKSQGMTSLGPLGIYHPTHNSSSRCSNCWGAKKPMNSYDPDNITTVGFMSINGGNFWVSNKTDIAEPNGDYYKNCWLGFWRDSNLNVRWYNDSKCNYSYTQYLCMAKDDVYDDISSYLEDLESDTNPSALKTFEYNFTEPLNSSSWKWVRTSKGQAVDSSHIWMRTNDGNRRGYYQGKSIDLTNKEIVSFEAQMHGVRIMDPDCRSNGVYICLYNPSNNAEICVEIQNNGSYSWSYRGHDKSLGGAGNFYKLNNFSRGYKQLIIFLRDSNGNYYRYTYSATEIPDSEGTMWGKIDWTKKKIYFKFTENGKVHNYEFDIPYPTNGLNYKNLGGGNFYPKIGGRISCTQGGVPYNTQQVYPDYIKLLYK